VDPAAYAAHLRLPLLTQMWQQAQLAQPQSLKAQLAAQCWLAHQLSSSSSRSLLALYSSCRHQLLASTSRSSQGGRQRMQGSPFRQFRQAMCVVIHQQPQQQQRLPLYTSSRRLS
jgi:hypothetical protein